MVRRIREARQLGGRPPWFTGGWPVRSMAIDRRERHVLVTGEDGIRLFHAATGEIERTFVQKPIGVSGEVIGFREDGSVAYARIGTFHGPKSFGVWDVETGAFLREFGGAASVVAIDGSGTRALTANNNGIHAWDLGAERVIRSIEKERGGYGDSVILEGTERAVVTVFAQSVFLWDFGAGTIVWDLKLGESHGEAHSITAPPGGDWFAVGDGNRCVHLHDVATGARRKTLGKPEPRPYGNSVGSLSVSRDGARIAAVAGTWLFVFDVASGEVLLQENLLPHDNQPIAQIAPSGTWVVGGGRSGELSRFEIGGPARKRERPLAHALRVRRAAFGENGEIWSSDGTLTLIWDAAGVPRRGELADAPEELRLDAAKPRFPYGTRPPWYERLDGAINAEIHRQDRSAHAPVVGGSIAANIMQDGEAVIWDLAISDEPIATLAAGTSAMETFPSRVWELAVHPDGRRVAIATNRADAPVQIFDGRSGELLVICEGHEAPATWVSFSRDGSKLVSGSMDRTVRVYDVDP